MNKKAIVITLVVIGLAGVVLLFIIPAIIVITTINPAEQIDRVNAQAAKSNLNSVSREIEIALIESPQLEIFSCNDLVTNFPNYQVNIIDYKTCEVVVSDSSLVYSFNKTPACAVLSTKEKISENGQHFYIDMNPGGLAGRIQESPTIVECE